MDWLVWRAGSDGDRVCPCFRWGAWACARFPWPDGETTSHGRDDRWLPGWGGRVDRLEYELCIDHRSQCDCAWRGGHLYYSNDGDRQTARLAGLSRKVFCL